jgi:lysophospholipase L1-like esterase
MSSDHPATRRRATLGIKISLLLVSIVVGLLLLEGAVRIRQKIRYGTTTGNAFQIVPDPATGLQIPLPGQDTGRIKINGEGFRSPEIPKARPDGTVRLAFMGASTTFCAEVSSNEATWPALVTKGLQERYPDVAFDYVNAGVPGYGLGSIRKALDLRVAPYNPNVIIFYEATNDLMGDTREIAARQGLFHDMAAEPSPLAKVSVGWYLIEKKMIAWRREKATASGVVLSYDPDSLAGVFAERLTGFLDDAKKITPVTAVATFAHKYRRDQPPKVALANARWSLYYNPYQSVENMIRSFESYNRAIRATAQANGAILVDGEDSIPGDDAHFADSIHFTDEGARAMAARVLRALEGAPEFQKLVEQEKKPGNAKARAS